MERMGEHLTMDQTAQSVIPAKVGIQILQTFLAPRLRTGDGMSEFCV